MEQSKLIVGIMLIVLGLLFFLSNKSMGKEVSKFYKWLYTEKNCKIMFKIAGIILIVGGILLMILK